MPYRVELASTSRAGCQDSLCKKDQEKIAKGTLRCGTWVETERYAGWRWKHWGCVSGKQLENIRNSLEHPTREGQYDWDMMDGLQGEDKKDRLPPDDQEKVKRCITQGFIDPEDWNGDPECNVLGRTGIHLAGKQRESKKAAEENAQENGDTPEKMKKRGRGKKYDAEDSEEEVKPAKKKGKNATKKEEGSEDEKPAKKSRAKSSVKEEDDDSDEVLPAKKQRGKKAAVKTEADDEVGKKAIPPKKRGKKTAVKEEASDDEVKTIKKQRGKKAAVKKEDASTLISGISDADLYDEFRTNLDDDDPDDDYENYVEIRKDFADAKSMGTAMQDFFNFKYGAEVEKNPDLIAEVGKVGKIFEEFLKMRSGYDSVEEMQRDLVIEKKEEKSKTKGRKSRVKNEPTEEPSMPEADKPAKRTRRSSRKQ